MASAANFNLNILFSRTDGKFIAAAAFHLSLRIIIWMYIFLHIIDIKDACPVAKCEAFVLRGISFFIFKHDNMPAARNQIYIDKTGINYNIFNE